MMAIALGAFPAPALIPNDFPIAAIAPNPRTAACAAELSGGIIVLGWYSDCDKLTMGIHKDGNESRYI